MGEKNTDDEGEEGEKKGESENTHTHTHLNTTSDDETNGTVLQIFEHKCEEDN